MGLDQSKQGWCRTNESAEAEEHFVVGEAQQFWVTSCNQQISTLLPSYNGAPVLPNYITCKVCLKAHGLKVGKKPKPAKAKPIKRRNAATIKKARSKRIDLESDEKPKRKPKAKKTAKKTPKKTTAKKEEPKNE